MAKLPDSCPDCGAGIVIGEKIAVCDANKYLSRNGAGDCRWELPLTPEMRRRYWELAVNRLGDSK